MSNTDRASYRDSEEEAVSWGLVGRGSVFGRAER